MRIKLVKSLIGRKDSHIDTAKSLGLKKIGDVSTQPDNSATRGKIKEISYLIEVQEV
ncbi:MAG: 50S ribosomal protein L30 [Oscillospiraceae bacterium]|jgi:large subunit ribosomal protein L30|nr:50S ribosomal protein L30 [Oscillospiraceae bacterium]